MNMLELALMQMQHTQAGKIRYFREQIFLCDGSPIQSLAVNFVR